MTGRQAKADGCDRCRSMVEGMPGGYRTSSTRPQHKSKVIVKDLLVPPGVNAKQARVARYGLSGAHTVGCVSHRGRRARGRTRSWRASTAASATNSSPSRC